MMEPGTFQSKIKDGRFVVTAEIGPPKSASGEDFNKTLDLMNGCADAYNVTDNQTATVRLSSLAGCIFCMRAGMEPILQMNCRDRNRIAIQADILGASSLGIHNVLCISGDHQSFGNQPDTRNVYDIDSTQELMILKKMRDEGKLWSGDALTKAPDIFLGAATNPFGDPERLHTIRLKNKCIAGAQFIQTQAVFDADGFEEWFSSVKKEPYIKDTAIIVGILPLRSLKATRFIANGVPGTYVPDDVIRRMSSASDENAEGLRIASELIERIRNIDGVEGLHMMPITWYSSIRPLLSDAGLLQDQSRR